MTDTLLDSNQILPNVYDATNGSLNVTQIAAGLVPGSYDSIALTYSGSNIATVKYYEGGLSGTLIRTLTLSYDVSNNLTSVVGT